MSSKTHPAIFSKKTIPILSQDTTFHLVTGHNGHLLTKHNLTFCHRIQPAILSNKATLTKLNLLSCQRTHAAIWSQKTTCHLVVRYNMPSCKGNNLPSYHMKNLLSCQKQKQSILSQDTTCHLVIGRNLPSFHRTQPAILS